MGIMTTAWVTTIVLAVAEPNAGTGPTSATGALGKWTEAIESSQVESVLAFYEQNDDVVIVHSTGELVKGTDAIRKTYQDAFAEVVFDDVSLKDLLVRQSGGMAWAACRFVADTTRHSDEAKWRIEIRTSFVLQRLGTSWKIALEHSSPIRNVPRVRRRE